MKKFIIFIVITILLIFGVRRLDETNWNNGVCPECGAEWELFDVENAAYYYKCENDHTVILLFKGDLYND